MRTLTVTCVGILLSLCVTPATAQACSVVITRQSGPAERMREARRSIREATAIVDGEVVRPLAGSQPALVRAARVLKGPIQDFFSVGERDSCDIALTDAGQRLRLILLGGPEVYFLPMGYSNARYEDRLLHSDRRRDWPYRGR
jgi:hypothetical protein